MVLLIWVCEGMEKFNIKEAPGYYRDERTGAVINTNMDGYNLILEKRRAAAEMSDLKAKLERLEKLIGKLANDDHRNTR